MSLRILTIILVLFGTSVFSSALAASLVGKVSLDGEGVAGVQLQAWPVSSLDFSGKPPFASAPSDAEGHFNLEVPEGQYYLLARSPEWFSYYGRNPVSVPVDGLADVNLPLVPLKSTPPQQAAAIDTGVMGLVTHAGTPVSRATVYVYPDLSAQLKGFGMGISAPTSDDGLFEMPLPSGSYYVVARVRQGGGQVGPLNAGDLFGYYPESPLVVEEGRVSRLQIPLIEVPEKVARHATSMFGNTRIVGRVVDVAGKPIAGIKAMLYTDPSMLDRPLYVSQPTGEAGTFVLTFPEGGHYYLAARDKLGGTPAPGELYGRYQGNPEHSLDIRSGQEINNIEIVVEEVW